MVKKHLLSFLILTVAAITTMIPLHAQAQHDGSTQTVTMIEHSFSLLPRHFYTMEFFNNPQLSESDFTMRLASYGVISGCASMYDSYLETKEVMGEIKITVSDSEPALDNYEPRYSNYDCEIKQNRAFFDVKLNRDELIENGTKHISLKSESYGNFAKFDIDINKQRAIFSIKNKNSTFLETFWFFPKNTVILHVPEAKLGQDVRELIKKFGKARGLIPMEDSYEGFKLPFDANSHAFFTDPTKYIVNRLTDIGQNTEVGEIYPTRTIYDASGSKEEKYSIKILATLPGKKVIDKYDEYIDTYNDEYGDEYGDDNNHNKYDKYLSLND